MLFRKTPTSERDNYVYRFDDGTLSVIAEGSITKQLTEMCRKEITSFLVFHFTPPLCIMVS